MSVTAFARGVGISRKTYYDWENGALPVLVKHAEKLSEVLGVAVEELSEAEQRKAPEAGGGNVAVEMTELKGRTQWAINHIIAEHGLSNVKLAGILGLSTSTIDSYRRGIKIPKAEILALIHQRYKISLDWIVDGLGRRFTDDGDGAPVRESGTQGIDPSCNGDAARLLQSEFVFIPQMAGTVSEGGIAPDGTGEMRIAFRRDWISRKGPPQNMSLIRVQGDSMEPTLISGDLALVDHSKDVTTRGGLFAITIDGEIMVKRIQPLMGPRLLVISDNQKYTTLEIAAEEIRINGKILWFGREIER